MPRYSVSGVDTNTANTTILGITGGTGKRLKIVEIHIGFDATPADMACKFDVQRTTAAGTATAFTPVPLDAADGAAVFTAGYAHSAEPTYTAGAVLLEVGVNQRTTWDWYAIPGNELVVPATANAGLALRSVVVGGTPVNCVATFIVEE